MVPFRTPFTKSRDWRSYADASHLSRLKKPPQLPNDAPQSVSEYRYVAGSEPRHKNTAVLLPLPSRTSLPSQLDSSIMRILRPFSACDPKNGFAIQDHRASLA